MSDEHQPTNAEIMAKLNAMADDHETFADNVTTALQGDLKERTPGLIAEVAENKRKLAIVSRCAWVAVTTATTAVFAAIWGLITGQTPSQ